MQDSQDESLTLTRQKLGTDCVTNKLEAATVIQLTQGTQQAGRHDKTKTEAN